MPVASDDPAPNKFVISADSTDGPTVLVNVGIGYDQPGTQYTNGSLHLPCATSEVSNVPVQQTHPTAAENSFNVVKSEVCVLLLMSHLIVVSYSHIMHSVPYYELALLGYFRLQVCIVTFYLIVHYFRWWSALTNHPHHNIATTIKCSTPLQLIQH